MVVAETMAAIALARSAVSGVQSVINTCKDVSEISGQIDQMFHAHEQVHKKSSAKGNKEWNNYLTQKLKDGGEEEGESFSDITAEIIEKKQIEEQLEQMKRMLNKRFGPDTWIDIVELREKRMAENKIKRAKSKVKFLEDREIKRKKTIKVLEWIMNASILIITLGGFALFLRYLAKCAGNCF
tara:strand:+ start:340 stop:888 length:549 start_codon:yes stop_codon:yes gene_type:complete